MKRLHPALLLLALVLVFFAGDRLIALGLKKLFFGSQFRYACLYRGGMHNDIVILGNSRGKAYYVPYMEEKLGVKCFNLAYDAMDTSMSAMLFTDYLQHNAPPKLLVVELVGMQVDSEQHEGSIKVFFGVSERFRRHIRAATPVSGALCDAVHVYRYNSEFFLRALSTRQSDQGWVNTAVITQAIVDEMKTGLTMQDNPPPQANYAYLKEILDLAEQNHITVRLVLNPFLPEFVGNATLLPYRQLIYEHTGLDVPVWDYRLALDDPALFADTRHINVAGSRALIDKQIADGFYNFEN